MKKYYENGIQTLFHEFYFPFIVFLCWNLNDNKSTPKIKKSDSPLISKIMVDLADEFNFKSHETSA